MSRDKRLAIEAAVEELADSVPWCLSVSHEQWTETPEIVRKETWRAVLELNDGIERYSPSAAAFEAVRPYHDRAVKSGTTLEKVLEAYSGMEKAWRDNPIVGFQAIAHNMGVDPYALAAHIRDNLPGASNAG